MCATVLYMSMSLDGFIAGPNEGQGNGLGDGGHRLHEWALPAADADRKTALGRLAGVDGQVVDEFVATGAVVAGRGTFEQAGGWGGDHHDGVPIFILSRQEPGIEIGQWPLVTYLTDVRTAMTQAKEAAGDKDVLVHGAGTAQLALAAGHRPLVQTVPAVAEPVARSLIRPGDESVERHGHVENGCGHGVSSPRLRASNVRDSRRFV